ncbi:MAG: response regulator transcription factor [Rhodobacteraceae bacterium]|nr:response regulator transcription factor [Paracoccaceae bacterium]
MDLAYPQALRAAEIAQELGDVWTEARAYDVIGFGQSASQPELAKETLEKCVALGKSINDDWAMSHGKKMTTAMYMFSHDHKGAAQPISDLVACSKQFDSRYLLAWAKALTGYFARDCGEFEAAEKALQLSIESSNLVGDPATGGFAMAWSAGLKADMGQVDVARKELQNLMASASITGTFLAVPEAMFILGSIEVAEGNHEQALQLVGPQITGLRNAGIPSWSEQLGLVAAAAHIALGNFAEADVLLNEAEQRTAPLNNPLINGLLHFTRGQHALARNDTGEAEMHLYKAVAVQLTGGLKPGLIRTAESIAGILVRKAKFSDAARVLAVVDRERADMPLKRGKMELSEHSALTEKVEQALDPDTLADIRASTARTSLDEIVESISRMRGQRARPLTGWTSLTPTENRVVTLVTEGLSNPQIAARMFIARGTVKIHISHIFDKLDVKSRTQLATKAITDGFGDLDP